jgi:hypothetical protein
MVYELLSEFCLTASVLLAIEWVSSFLRSEVTVVKTSIVVFWVVPLCGLLDDYQRGTYRLHLQGEVSLYQETIRRRTASGNRKKKKTEKVA